MNKKSLPLKVLHDFDYRILHARSNDTKILQDFSDMLDSNLSLIYYATNERIFCKSKIGEGYNSQLIGTIIDKDHNNSRIDLKIEIDGKINLKSIYIQSFLRNKEDSISTKLTDKLYDLAVRVNKYE